MLVLLSPAKTLDMTPVSGEFTLPRLLEQSEQLASALRRKSRSKLQQLMSISEKLAALNYERYQDFSLPFTPENAKPAVLAFRGDVYQDLEADDFSLREMETAQRQLRILSGLYGLLRPLDLIQAYRLEMGTKLKYRRKNDLYAFWGDRITDLLNEDLATEGSGLVLNLASQEYFRSLNPDRVAGRVLTVHFKEPAPQGGYRVISFNAKRARGRLAQLITKEGISTADPIQELEVNEYRFDEKLSEKNEWVFVR